MKSVIGAVLAIAVTISPRYADAQVSPPVDTVEAPQNSTPQPPNEPSPLAKEEAPKHVSTGWGALFKATMVDFTSFPKRTSTWAILGIGGAAALATHPVDNKVQQQIVGNDAADKFFSLGQWVGSTYGIAASSVGLWAVGRYVIGPSKDVPRTNKWSEMGFDMMRAQILSQVFVQSTKQAVRRDRPTGVCCSFPSGHAASAFAAASVLERRDVWRCLGDCLRMDRCRETRRQRIQDATRTGEPRHDDSCEQSAAAFRKGSLRFSAMRRS